MQYDSEYRREGWGDKQCWSRIFLSYVEMLKEAGDQKGRRKISKQEGEYFESGNKNHLGISSEKPRELERK